MRQQRKKGYDYYEMFIDMAGYACQITGELQKIIEDFQVQDLEEKIEKIHEIEHAADLKIHEMMQNLVKEFLPPIEREDIMLLSQELDDVVDSVEDILLRLYMYNVEHIRDGAIEFMDIIAKCCKAMKKMMEEFPSFRKKSDIRKLIIEVNNLEEDGDRLYVENMRKLYKEEKDISEVIVWTQIFECFENCCDSCEEVAETVESIVMKNM